MSERILVTGGTGFIGSHLVEKLIKRDNCDLVLVIDNYSMSSLENIEHLQENEKITIIEVDVTDYDQLAFNLIKYGINTVCHLAVRPLVHSLYEPFSHADEIIKMIQSILECQRKGYFKRLISFSTSEVYGSSEGLKLNEESRLSPQTPYAAAKASCDLLIKSYSESFDIEYTIVRPFNNYGPRKKVFRSKAGIIPTSIRLLSEGGEVPLFGGGKAKRDFVFVKDTVEAVLTILDMRKETKNEMFIIATGETHSMKEVVLDIARLMNVEPRINVLPDRQGDASYLCGDGAKVKAFLGFEPKTKWEDGLQACIDYYSRKK